MSTTVEIDENCDSLVIRRNRVTGENIVCLTGSTIDILATMFYAASEKEEVKQVFELFVQAWCHMNDIDNSIKNN